MQSAVKDQIFLENGFEFVGAEDVSEACSDEQSSDLPGDNISQTNKETLKAGFDQYVGEWNEIKTCDLNVLKGSAIKGHLRLSNLRSVYWRIFLKLYDFNASAWINRVKEQRHNYKRLVKELEGTPREDAIGSDYIDDPLSQCKNSRWQRYFCDEELRGLIRQDVIRTFPGVEFFRSEDIQLTMVRILFIYARSHPTLCYRQGMHEVLAPILYVLHSDHTAFLQYSESNELPSDLAEVLDPSELAADAYMIFDSVMSHLESSYYIASQGSTSHSSPEKVGERCENEVVVRLEWIRENLLRGADPDLAQYLLLQDIPLQLFGIRWLRLLFGREFPLQDLLVLWDAIFSTEDLYLVNFVVTAMLVAIRHLLIGQDNSSCLSHLMKYPAGVSVYYVIDLALYLAHPSQCPPPPLPPPPKHMQNTRRTLNRLASFRGQKSEHLRSLPVKSLAVGHTDKGSTALDGFTLEDPRLLKTEVENLRAVIGLVELKVSQYHIALQDAVFQSADPEALQAWEGLSELCCLLKNITVTTTNDVEAADEAGEGKFGAPDSAKKEKIEKEPEPEKQPTSNIYRPEMQLIRTTIGPDCSTPGVPMVDPLRRTEIHFFENDWRYFPKDFNRHGALK